MVNLEKEVSRLMHKGVYDPEVLFKRIYADHPVHYSKIREAIHAVKTS